MSIRHLKRRSRMLLHERLSEPVWFFMSQEAEPIETTVRLHLQFDQAGALLREQFAVREETDPKIIFLTPIQPIRNSYVVTEDMGLYFVDTTQPADDITITANVKLASERDIVSCGLTPNTPWMGLPPPPSLVGAADG